MSELMLIQPDLAHKAMAQAYIEEHRAVGEMELHGGAWMEKMPYEEWLQRLKDNACPETVYAGWVVSSTFLVQRAGDRRWVGMVDIRHTLNDFLRSYGGHIGFGIRPSERGKGYAAQILTLALEYARSIPLARVMVACNSENDASRKTILRCGGQLEREFLHPHGKIIQVYWIELATPPGGPAAIQPETR